jgi:hypothetical protein
VHPTDRGYHHVLDCPLIVVQERHARLGGRAPAKKVSVLNSMIVDDFAAERILADAAR